VGTKYKIGAAAPIPTPLRHLLEEDAQPGELDVHHRLSPCEAQVGGLHTGLLGPELGGAGVDRRQDRRVVLQRGDKLRMPCCGIQSGDDVRRGEAAGGFKPPEPKLQGLDPPGSFPAADSKPCPFLGEGHLAEAHPPDVEGLLGLGRVGPRPGRAAPPLLGGAGLGLHRLAPAKKPGLAGRSPLGPTFLQPRVLECLLQRRSLFAPLAAARSFGGMALQAGQHPLGGVGRTHSGLRLRSEAGSPKLLGRDSPAEPSCPDSLGAGAGAHGGAPEGAQDGPPLGRANHPLLGQQGQPDQGQRLKAHEDGQDEDDAH